MSVPLLRRILPLVLAALVVASFSREAAAPAPAPVADVSYAMLGGFVDKSVYEAMNPAQRRMALSIVRGDLPDELPALCFDEESEPRMFEWFLAVWDKSPRFQFDDGNRWSSTATDGGGLGQGDPTTITWGFVADGVNVSGGVGEPSAPSNLIAFLDAIYGSGPGGSDYTQRPWFPLFQMVFDSWTTLIGTSYVYEPNDDGNTLTSGGNPGVLGVRPDVRIGGHYIDGNSGVLAYNYFPQTGDMVIDTGDGFYGTTTQNSRRLRNVVAHEHGHGLGIYHVCPINQTKLMEPNVTTTFDGPQFDDRLAGNRGYGDHDEYPAGNDSPAAATDLGPMGLSTSQNRFRLSIDDDSDVDFFAFTVPAGAMATARIIPEGFLYLQGPQNGDGTCTPGTTYHPENASDLAIELRDTSGTGVLAVADANGPGGTEQVTDVVLTGGAGTYYVRVSGSANAAQAYFLTIWVNPAPAANNPPTASCQDVFSCDGNVVAADVDNGSMDPDGDPLDLTLEPAGPFAPGTTDVQLIVSDGDLADTCAAVITVTCQGPVLELTPSVVTFPAVAWGDTACREITLRNTGDLPLDVVSIDGCDAGGFFTLQDDVATPVAAGDSTLFSICFTPQGAGPDSCTVTVVTGDSTASITVHVGEVTSVPGGGEPRALTLGPAFPNPFRAGLNLRFTLAAAAPVRLAVFDLRGRMVRELAGGEVYGAGAHTVRWDGRTRAGAEAAAGIYLIRVATPEASSVVRAVRTK